MYNLKYLYKKDTTLFREDLHFASTHLITSYVFDGAYIVYVIILPFTYISTKTVTDDNKVSGLNKRHLVIM